MIRVAPLAGERTRGKLVAGPLVLPCALGRSGVRRAKREGDGATPQGVLRPVAAWCRGPRPAAPLLLPWRRTQPDDGWCDDAASPLYNRPVRLPFAPSHERLWRDDRLYDLVLVLDYNLARPRPGAGSAIFLHVAADGFAPTAGCVALRKADLLRLAPRLSPRTRLVVA